MWVRSQDSGGGAGGFAGVVLCGVWAQDRNIVEPHILAEMAAELGLDAAALLEADGRESYGQRGVGNSEQAIARGVFGIPIHIYRGAVFWDQDRLDFLERVLRA